MNREERQRNWGEPDAFSELQSSLRFTRCDQEGISFPRCQQVLRAALLCLWILWDQPGRSVSFPLMKPQHLALNRAKGWLPLHSLLSTKAAGAAAAPGAGDSQEWLETLLRSIPLPHCHYQGVPTVLQAKIPGLISTSAQPELGERRPCGRGLE